MPSPEEQEWFLTGYLKGLSGDPIEPVLKQFMDGGREHLDSLKSLKEAQDREAARQDDLLKQLSEMSDRQSERFRNLVREVTGHSDVLTTMHHGGGAVWLGMSVAPPSIPAVVALYQLPESGRVDWVLLMLAGWAAWLLVWRGAMKFVAKTRRERLVASTAGVWTVASLAVTGVVLAVAWPRLGLIAALISGAAGGLAIAAHWTIKDSVVPVVTDLVNQLMRVRQESATHASERSAGVSRLRQSAQATVQTIAGIEAQRARFHEVVVRAYQLGTAIRLRKESRRQRGRKS